MKTRNHIRLLSAALAALPLLLQAQPTAHYVPGFEGIKGASLPPPGFYLRDYNIAYHATQVNDAVGQSAGPPNFDAFFYGNVPRVIWITETKFLGGFVGVDSLLPIIYKSIEAGPLNQNSLGIGDLFAEATLSWHPKQFDLALGCGVHMPTGNSGSPSSAGLGYWTPMLTAGATWYLDSEKTWSLSALCRYEFNTEQRDTKVTPGQAFTLEWGIGKTLNKTIDVGVVGYYQQQVTDDSVTLPGAVHDRVASVGPEISVAFPKPMLFVSFRYLYEFMAEDRARGQTFSLTFTKRF